MNGEEPEFAVSGGPLRYLWWLVACQPGRAVAGAVLGSTWMVGLTVPPYLLSRTIDDGLAPGHAGALAWWLAALLSAGLANAWLGITRHRVMTRLRMDALHRTVLAVVRQSTRLGAALPGRVAAGEVITIGVSDVAVISQTLTIAGPGVGAVVAYLVIAALLLAVSAPLAVVVLVGVPALAVLVGPLLGRLRRIQHGYRDQQGALTARFADLAAGLRVLNGLGGKDTFADRYRRDSQRLVAEGYRVAAVTSWVLALGLGLPTVFLAAVIWLAARLAASGGLTPGQLVAVYGYAALLVVPVSFFLEGAHDLTHGLVAARRVTNFLSLPPTDLPASTRAAPGGLAALHDPGSGVTVPVALLTALVSGQPADPVAIVDRLGGFSSSQATWGGVPLARIDPGEVRRRILVADNEADLFTGTLRDTILGPQAAATGTSGVVGADAGADAGAATDVEVMRVVEAAAARDVVDGLAGGLDGELTAQGRNLSGGQRQRVRLARALLADPEVLLAVEPTSAVDAHTEATIAERLRAYRASRTTLVTSTSPLLLDRVDLVHYLVDGRVVASGTHRHLLATQPGYHHLVQRGDDDPADLDGTAGPPGWFDTVAAQVASNDETTGIAGRHGGQVNRAGEVADVGLGEGGGSEGARW